MAIIGIIIVGIILIAIFKTAQTQKDLNDPIFQFYVDKYVTEYITQTGSKPPNYLMPEIYKRARNEIKSMSRETPPLKEPALNEAEAWLVKKKYSPTLSWPQHTMSHGCLETQEQRRLLVLEKA